MKRTIRSVVLAGVIVISILLSGPQPVQAGKSPTRIRVAGYIGHIHLRAQVVMDMDNADSAFFYTFFETRGPIYLSYSHSAGLVTIFSDKWNILQGVGESGIYGAVLSGSAESIIASSYALSKAPSGTDFPFFTIPISAKNPNFYAQNCWQMGDDPCSHIDWSLQKKRVSDLATYLTTMKLKVIVDDIVALSGSCSLPGWDEHEEPHMTYSETCHWSSHYVSPTEIKPEWERKK